MRTDMDTVLDGMCGLLPVKARWLYSRHDPLVLVMQIVTIHGPITWLLSRDLLRDGLNTGQAGIGDVRVDVDESLNTMVIELNTPTGHCLLSFDAPDVSDLLDATGKVVPFGKERGLLDVDGFLKRVVAS